MTCVCAAAGAALLVHETMRVKQLSLGLTGPGAQERGRMITTKVRNVRKKEEEGRKTK